MLEIERSEAQELRRGGTSFTQVLKGFEQQQDGQVIHAEQLYAKQEAAGILPPEIPLKVRFAEPKIGR